MPRPAADSLHPPQRNVRIVRQGLDNSRNGDGNAHGIASFHRYKLAKDEATGLLRIRPARLDVLQFNDFDVDGDGETQDDVVACHPFDLDEKNPLTPVAPFYDTSVGTQRFYGAATIFHANKTKSGFSEDGINGGEEGPNNQPRRNWTFFHETYEIDSPYRMHFLALWQKFDFLNGGNNHRVSFDEKSELRHLVMRYYMGIEGFRWVVRNGDSFFISEKVYEYADASPGKKGGVIHSIHPATERWAPYHPQAPYKIDFSPENAVFEKRSFDDVTAVGWLMFKDSLVSGYVGYKWYAFEADALVHQHPRPSESIDMKEIRPKDAPPFFISTCEVPYILWSQVHRLARSNTFAGPRGFGFDDLGSMGSMAWPDKKGNYLPHSTAEPVTGIPYLDALAWCNALSVQESRRPCYYTDPDFQNPFREVEKNRVLFGDEKPDAIYLDWAADGYRLPTPSEWGAAAGDLQQQLEKLKPKNSTAPVGSSQPNSLGIFDMAGNVRELAWTHGSRLSLEKWNSITVLGMDFRGKGKPAASSASAYGDRPFNGSACIGLRLVRRHPSLPPPPEKFPPSTPTWNISRKTLCSPDPKRQTEPPVPTVPVPEKNFAIGTTEISFAQWQPVRDWAVAHGYSFDFAGDMGSMAYGGFEGNPSPPSHSPQEPVTAISFYDAAIWCNALSEQTGKTPVYYTDASCSTPFRSSPVFRPPQLLLGEIAALEQAIEIKKGLSHNGLWPELHILESADGYRLPASKEILSLYPQNGKAPFAWGETETEILDIAWLADNSGFHTHPIGQKKPTSPGVFDLFGNVAELAAPAPAKGEKSGYADRMGGSFLDPSHYLMRSMVPEQSFGLPYPDIGFRVLLQTPTPPAQ